MIELVAQEASYRGTMLEIAELLRANHHCLYKQSACFSV